MLALTTIFGLLLAPIAVVTGEPWMNVNYFAFIGQWMLLSVPLLLATYLLRRQQVLRPVNAKIFSWEVWLFAMARWPYVAWGFASGLKERLFPHQRSFKVTPKGDRTVEPLPVRLVVPYLAVCAITLLAVLGRSPSPSVRYYVLICLMSGGSYLLVSGVIIALHAVETRRATLADWSDIGLAVRPCLIALGVFCAAWLATVLTVVPTLFAVVHPGLPPGR